MEKFALLKYDLEEDTDLGDLIYGKDIWVIICEYLKLNEILNLTLLNKRFERMINNNKILWNKLKNRKISKHHEIEYFPKNPFDKISTWSSMKNRFFIKKEEWYKKSICEEKKEYIDHTLDNLYGERIISKGEKITFNFLENLEKYIKFKVLIIPLFLLLFSVLLELKFYGIIPFPYLFCLLPIFFLLAHLIFYICYFIFSMNKRWKNFFCLREYSRAATRPTLFFFSLTLITSFLSLIISVVRLDNIIEWNWGHILFFWDSFAVSLVIFSAYSIFFDEKIRPKHPYYISLTISSFLLVLLLFIQLSFFNIFPQRMKWVISFIPLYGFDFLAVIILVYLIFFAMTWSIREEVFLNINFIVSFLCLFAFTVLIVLLLQDIFPSPIYVISSVQGFLFFFQLFFVVVFKKKFFRQRYYDVIY